MFKALALVLMLCGTAIGQARPEPIRAGEAARPLRVQDVRHRQAFDLADYRGKWVVVHFFRAEDDNSAAAMQELVDIRTAYAKEKFMVLGVSTDTNPAAVRKLVEQKKVDWPIHYDPRGKQGQAAVAWGVDEGRVFIIDPAGVVVWSGTPPQLRRAMKQHAGEPGAMKDAVTAE